MCPADQPFPRNTTEVGRLRTVLLHRPGNELKRLTPRNNDQLLFDGIPWVSRAQDEHDAFAELLRSRGVDVLLLGDVLVETLKHENARLASIDSVVNEQKLGQALAETLRAHLDTMAPVELANVLTAGMTFAELPASASVSLVRRMHESHDFVVAPLPNLMFTRDSSVWVADQVVVSTLSMPARRREASIMSLIYDNHPRFAQMNRVYRANLAPLEGGDVLLLAPGVLAVGVGERTSAAGAESFAKSLFRTGVAHTVLIVPIEQSRATMHLDTVCTMVDKDAVLMYPAISETLSAYAVKCSDSGELLLTGPAPFLELAAAAMGIDRLRVIDTGLDPVTAEREQWDDGNNTLALAPGVVIAYERNVETNARLLAASIEVLTISGTELGSGRGGPRCMSCPISRDPLES